MIDWGSLAGLHVFCAVLAWCRVRFVRFAADERAETTLAMLAECFEVLGGVPGKVLADRMGCLKGGVVANVVVPAPEYLRLAAHYGFRPDFCEAADPESKGIVENLVGYAKRDLIVPQAPFADLAAANTAGRGVVRRGQRRDPQRDLRGAGGAAGHRTRTARPRCRRCGRHRAAGDPQGRPAFLRAVRLGPLLSAHPADRRPRSQYAPTTGGCW